MNVTTFTKSLALSALLSVAATAAMADMTQKEKAVLFYEAYNQNNPDLLDQALATDWESIPAAPGREQGLAAFKASVAAVPDVFADLNLVNDDILEDGNKVIVRSTVSATNVGSFAGFPAKNRPFTMMAIDIHEFNEDGLIARTWHVEDWLSGLFQMGAFEQ